MNSLRGGSRSKITVSGLFLASRLILLLSLPLQGVKSYGDFWNFYGLAGLGRPFWDLWVEFPPVFPFLSRGIYLLAGGREQTYIYLVVILFSLVQAGSLYLFQGIAAQIWGEKQGLRRSIIYAFIIAGLFYGWAYFDCLAVFLILLGMDLLLKSRPTAAGIILGLGGLVKWFPVLVLPAAWKWLGGRKAFRAVISAFLLIVLVWGILYLASPAMTKASVTSQGAKGSWESVWAILDGNLGTGNFNPAADRRDPATATLPAGNPSRISPWLTLVAFAGLGMILFWKARVETGLQVVALSGLTLSVFFLWSPGYSPQWTLYLLPVILLSFDGIRPVLVGLVVLLVNLLEWPLLLSRGLFQFLPAVVILRTVIFALIAVMFAGVVIEPKGITQESGL